MKPIEEARATALRVGLNFEKALQEHLEHGFVWCSPDCFILATESWRDFEDETKNEPAWFITLAVGDIGQFIKIDPKPNKKWLGFCRKEGGPVHWLDYQELRRKHISLE